MKIISGVYKRNGGDIVFDGKAMGQITPKESQEAGISIIYQEFNLISCLSVAENIFLGRLTKGSGQLVDWKENYHKAETLLKEMNYLLNVRKLVRELSVAQKQMVEIAKALSFNAKLVIMDEPSSALTSGELATFFKVIDKLKKKGITIIYISHKLDEIFQLCDRVTVFRDGKVVGTKNVADCKREEIISMMVGRPLDMEFPKRESRIGEEIMRVENFSVKGKVHNVGFTLHKGEVLGIVGLVGAGRTELVRALYGADKKAGGKLFIRGTEVKIHSPQEAIANNMAMLTEDRRELGLFLNYSVTENIVSAAIDKIANAFFVSPQKGRTASMSYIKNLKIRTPDPDQYVRLLSGGNQQKVVVAKSLFADPDILIMDEPTRGIDVGAKYEIYLLINQLAAEGKSIIFISSELPEVLSMSDRVIVLYEGRLNGEFERKDMDSERVIKAAIGE
jgi:ABC-type sugar transport system ATPase subunit